MIDEYETSSKMGCVDFDDRFIHMSSNAIYLQCEDLAVLATKLCGFPHIT